MIALVFHLDAADVQFGVGNTQVDAALGNVDFDGVTLLDQADGAAFGRFRKACPIDRPEVPPEKRPSVSSARALPRPLDLR